jgi:hypothetical protein
VIFFIESNLFYSESPPIKSNLIKINKNNKNKTKYINYRCAGEFHVGRTTNLSLLHSILIAAVAFRQSAETIKMPRRAAMVKPSRRAGPVKPPRA